MHAGNFKVCLFLLESFMKADSIVKVEGINCSHKLYFKPKEVDSVSKSTTIDLGHVIQGITFISKNNVLSLQRVYNTLFLHLLQNQDYTLKSNFKTLIVTRNCHFIRNSILS